MEWWKTSRKTQTDVANLGVSQNWSNTNKSGSIRVLRRTMHASGAHLLGSGEQSRAMPHFRNDLFDNLFQLLATVMEVAILSLFNRNPSLLMNDGRAGCI